MNRLFVFIIFATSNVSAIDYYVRPDTSHSAARDGRNYRAAWSQSEIGWNQLKAGDILYLCGKFTETLSLGGNESIWGGTHGSNITITGACVEEVGSIQHVTGNAIEITRREYITISDLLINDATRNGITAYGRGGSGTMEANRDLNIRNVVIKNTGGSGIILSCLNGYPNYAPQTGIVIENVTIENPAQHGIYASCYQDGTIIRHAHVSGAATAGNYWGIDVSSRFINYTGNSWDRISGTVYKINMAEVNPNWDGKPDWETITQIIHTTISPHHLAQNQACTDIYSCGANLGLFEFSQIGSDIYINVGESPNSHHIAIVSSPFGSITVENSYVTSTSSNGGTTDGVGIGADLGTNQVTFRHNISENNQGSGFELAGAAEAIVHDNSAVLNGKWGFSIHKSWGDGVKLFRNKAINNGTWQYYISNNFDTPVSFKENYGEGGTECLHLTDSPFITLENNTCIKTKGLPLTLRINTS